VAYPNAAPAPAHKVKKSKGVLWGIVLILLSVAVAVAGVIIGAIGIGGAFSEFKTVPSGTSTVQLKPGEHNIYSSSSSFLSTPEVTILSPSGGEVPISRSSSSSTYSNSSDTYTATGSFNAPTDGTYTVKVGSENVSGSGGLSTSSRTSVAIGPPGSEIAAALGIGFALIFGGLGLGTLLFIIGVVALIVGLVRSSKAKNPPTTPYGGYGGGGYGTYGAPAPGGYTPPPAPGGYSPPPAPGGYTPPTS
jgi:hypothetical protein